MFSSCRAVIPVILLAIAATPKPVWSQSDASTEAEADNRSPLEAIVLGAFPSDGPGASVIVVKDGKVLYRGSHGLANVELGVRLQPQSVLRIGSITKQFTAAAILLLAEEKKLSLADPLTKFLPDYPTQDHVVTIQHLLGHTSGIPNYTELPEWSSTIRNDVSADHLIDLFKNKPLDFAPGEQWRYSNSGYVLLGAVIEKVSGQTYAEFVRTRVFEPLGMNHSRYDDSIRLLPGRANGYSRRGEHWVNADYLSMTHPYSAGALVSGVDDLALWNSAMDANKLLSRSSWERAVTTFTLNDAMPTRYGAGWIIGRIGSIPTVEHGGGINGFNAYVLRVPSKRLYIAVLANAAPPQTPPQQVALQLATHVLGTTLHTPEIRVDAAKLDEYVGLYRVKEGQTRAITRRTNRLHVQEGAEASSELTPIATDLFEARANQARFRFLRKDGAIIAVQMEPRILMGDRAPASRIQR
jgi:D-alanyl-D-alanine carboxypeptidase